MKLFPSLIAAVLFLFISGCASENPMITTYEILYQPVKENEVTSYFVGGLPLGAISDDSASMMFALQPAVVNNQGYLRLWYMYKNKSSEEYLIEPMKSFEFQYVTRANNTVRYTTTPMSPLEILKSIEDTKQQKMILETIGSVLKTLATQDEDVKLSDGLTATDKSEKKKEKISAWYDMFAKSFSNGVLRKNTLFKDDSANGYVYFDVPSEGYPMSGEEYNNYLKSFTVKLKIKTQFGEKIVNFKSIKGE